MNKLKVYIHSFEMPTVGFVDKEGAMHACAQAQKTAFRGLERFSGLFGNRCLSDDERQFLMMVEAFCKNNGLEFEIIDVGTVNFLTRMKLQIKGLRTPAIKCGEKIVQGSLGEDDLQNLLRS